jgi:hypothetical protein
MRTGYLGWVVGCMLFGALVLGTGAAPVSAVQTTTDDCRCVDADGDAIADCTCFRAPRVEAFAPLAWGLNRPRLGINVSASQSSELDARGAEVNNVLEDGPAWNAGIREGDVITSIDGQSLFEPLSGDREDDFDLDQSIPVQRLLAIARELEPGEEVEVTYLRGGDEQTATITAEDLSGREFGYMMPGFDAERFRGQLRDLTQNVPDLRLRDVPDRMSVVRGTPGAFYFDGAFGAAGRYGLELVEMNEGLGQYFGTTEGVLVVNVAEDSQLRLQSGDVILRIGDRAADTADRVLRILGSYAADEDITLQIRRDGREMSVMGRLER